MSGKRLVEEEVAEVHKRLAQLALECKQLTEELDTAQRSIGGGRSPNTRRHTTSHDPWHAAKRNNIRDLEGDRKFATQKQRVANQVRNN